MNPATTLAALAAATLSAPCLAQNPGSAALAEVEIRTPDVAGHGVELAS
jgi:hypothetical protein